MHGLTLHNAHVFITYKFTEYQKKSVVLLTALRKSWVGKRSSSNTKMFGKHVIYGENETISNCGVDRIMPVVEFTYLWNSSLKTMHNEKCVCYLFYLYFVFKGKPPHNTWHHIQNDTLVSSPMMIFSLERTTKRYRFLCDAI